MPTYKLNGFDGQKYHIPSNNDVLESECDVNVAGKIAITVESTTPPQPPDGEGFLYSKNDGKLYWRSFDVGETDLTGGGGGGGSPSGNDEEIQYNNQGSFGASSNLTFSQTNNQMTVTGTSRQCDTGYATTAQKLLSFTYRRHYNFSSIAANTWTNVVSFRPYVSGTTNDPSANTFWTGVGFKMEITGHTNGTGNGYRSRTGFVSYVGSSATSANASDTTLGSPISTDISLSGWVTTLRINPNQANASGFSGTVYLEIYFARGAGSNGQNIEWSIT